MVPGTTTPPLWPGFRTEEPTRFATAWRWVWATLDHEQWTDHNTLAEGIMAHDLKRQTANSLLTQARKTRLIQRRGGYSNKHQRDTRQYRIHPKANA